MRRFLHGLECIHADDHASFVPAAGATVWIGYRPWKVLASLADATRLDVVVLPLPAWDGAP